MTKASIRSEPHCIFTPWNKFTGQSYNCSHFCKPPNKVVKTHYFLKPHCIPKTIFIWTVKAKLKTKNLDNNRNLLNDNKQKEII